MAAMHEQQMPNPMMNEMMDGDPNGFQMAPSQGNYMQGAQQPQRASQQ